MASEQVIIELLTEIRDLLSRQTAPIVALEAEQLAKANPTQRKAHNKAILARAKQKLSLVQGRGK